MTRSSAPWRSLACCSPRRCWSSSRRRSAAAAPESGDRGPRGPRRLAVRRPQIRRRLVAFGHAVVAEHARHPQPIVGEDPPRPAAWARRCSSSPRHAPPPPRRARRTATGSCPGWTRLSNRSTEMKPSMASSRGFRRRGDVQIGLPAARRAARPRRSPRSCGSSPAAGRCGSPPG